MSPIYDRDYMRSREERGPLGWLNPNGSMVKALILANVAVFLLDALSNHALTDLLLLHPWYISHLQLWRLFSYQFAHGGFMHLLFNMYGLWLFGQGVEQLLGQRRFLQLYLFSGVVGALIWLLANWWGGGMAVIVQDNGAMGRYLYKSISHLDAVLSEHPEYRLVSVYGGCVDGGGRDGVSKFRHLVALPAYLLENEDVHLGVCGAGSRDGVRQKQQRGPSGPSGRHAGGVHLHETSSPWTAILCLGMA